MNQLDNEFFEEFKKLDNLCKDIYGKPDSRLSLSLYLEDMEDQARLGELKVPGWVQDYQHLKKCRSIRNKLAHGDNYPPEGLCSQYDIEFLHSFRQSILDETDPLAQLNKNSRRRTCGSFEDEFGESPQRHDDASTRTVGWLVFGDIVIAILFIACIVISFFSSESLWGTF